MDAVLENLAKRIATNTARPSESAGPAASLHLRNSFGSAYWALAFALSIPIAVFIFGAIRAREFKLAVDPRWAQFVPFMKLNTTTHANESRWRSPVESGRIPVHNASIRTENLTSELTTTPTVRHPELESECTVPENDHSVVEQPFEEPTWRTTLIPPNSESRLEPEQFAESDHQSADMADTTVESEIENATETEIAKSTVRIESQMREVRQRLDQLVDRLAMQHVEHCDESQPIVTPIDHATESSSSQEPIRIRRKTGPDLVDVFTMDVHDADLRQFLVKLSEVAQVGILPSPAVQGEISLHLHEVRLESALKAIVRSRDYAFEREHGIIVIRTADEAAKLRHSGSRLAAKTDGPK